MARLTLSRTLGSASLLVAVPLFTSLSLNSDAPVAAAPSAAVANASEEPVPVRSNDVAPAKAVEPRFVPPVATPKLAKNGSQSTLDAEIKLHEMGYWMGKLDGILDYEGRLGLIAFQKVEGRQRTGRLDATEREAIIVASRPVALESGSAHVEVDLSRQVLFFVDDAGIVQRTIAVSTGNNKDYVHKGVKDRAYTPRGRWQVYNKIAGMRKAPLGNIFYPNYLVGGIAIHGSPSIPIYPASHGCVRIPMYAAKEIASLVPMGTTVIVHDAGSFENDARWLKWANRSLPKGYEPLVKPVESVATVNPTPVQGQ